MSVGFGPDDLKIELSQFGGLQGSTTVIVKFEEYWGISLSNNLTASLTMWSPTRDLSFVET